MRIKNLLITITALIFLSGYTKMNDIELHNKLHSKTTVKTDTQTTYKHEFVKQIKPNPPNLDAKIERVEKEKNRKNNVRELRGKK